MPRKNKISKKDPMNTNSEPEKKEHKEIYDALIMGGGPAGLNAALYVSGNIMKTVLISETIGGQVADTYDIDNYLGFSDIEALDLIKKFDEHVEQYGIEKKLGQKVESIDLEGKIKKATTSDGQIYLTKTIIVASGKRPRLLNIPGEKELFGKGVNYCSICETSLLMGKNVAVIGGGNSALEAALYFNKIAKNIYLISRSLLTGAQITQKKVKELFNVTIYENCDTQQIVGKNQVQGLQIKSLETGEIKEIDVTHVFVEIGLTPNSEIFQGKLAINKRGEIEIDHMCRTSVPGVFACGDVTSVPFKQVIIAAGEGAKAGLAAYDYVKHIM
jgi:alkyl hydroperoxide reductase subunit F